tara:strand:+ start:2198 stop:2920 length:723 start_codon:yes stop_codon:yes gene_type:complete
MRFHRVYYKEFKQTDKISIDDKSKINHLRKVLRLSEGSQVDVFDGKGNSSICRIVSLEKKEIVLEQIGDTGFQKSERINLKVLIPYIKKENLFFAVQKVTEIGVSNISLFRPDKIDQSIKKKDLLKINEKALSIIIQACEQNGSNIVPDFQIYEDLSSAIDHDSLNIFFDLDATNDFQSIKSIEDNITLITGPESGFSKREKELLNAGASHNISLGKNILRAETAPITALSVIKSNLGLL